MDVRTVSFLADGMKVQVSEEVFEVLVTLALWWAYGQPLWLLFGRQVQLPTSTFSLSKSFMERLPSQAEHPST
jgi:hypothetical protein